MKQPWLRIFNQSIFECVWNRNKNHVPMKYSDFNFFHLITVFLIRETTYIKYYEFIMVQKYVNLYYHCIRYSVRLIQNCITYRIFSNLIDSSASELLENIEKIILVACSNLQPHTGNWTVTFLQKYMGYVYMWHSNKFIHPL